MLRESNKQNSIYQVSGVLPEYREEITAYELSKQEYSKIAAVKFLQLMVLILNCLLKNKKNRIELPYLAGQIHSNQNRLLSTIHF